MNGDFSKPEAAPREETPDERIERVFHQVRDLIVKDPERAVSTVASVEVLNQLRQHPIDLYEPDPRYPYAEPTIMRKKNLGSAFMQLADREARVRQRSLQGEAVRALMKR